MRNVPPSRVKAILVSFGVVFIWATSWVLIKIGLGEIPPLTFAGLRYFIAFLFLVPFLLKKDIRGDVRSMSKTDWMLVAILGLVSIFIAQGSQFLSLDLLPATTVSLILNISSVIVAFSAILLIKEIPTALQWLGLAVNLAGVMLFFLPANFSEGKPAGYLFAVSCLVANSLATLLGRKINRKATIHPLTVTLLSLGIGSIIMLVSGIAVQGLPALSTKSILIILLLAVVNTAFAFTMWNYALQTLSAIESSIINGTMMVQVAILAWIFLDEVQNPQQIIALMMAFLGAVIVNLKRRTRVKKTSVPE